MNEMNIFKLAQQFEKLAQEDKVWVIVHDIYEPKGAGSDYPVVRHTFVGRTKEEAQGYFDSHMKTDEFFRDCEEKRKWEDVECEVKTRTVEVPIEEIKEAYREQ